MKHLRILLEANNGVDNRQDMERFHTISKIH